MIAAWSPEIVTASGLLTQATDTNPAVTGIREMYGSTACALSPTAIMVPFTFSAYFAIRPAAHPLAYEMSIASLNDTALQA